MILHHTFNKNSPNEARTPSATRSNCFEVVLGSQLGLALVLFCMLFANRDAQAQDMSQSPFFRNDSPEKIESAVHSGLSELWLSDDYLELIQEHPEARGFVEYEITIKKKGHVESVRRTETSITDLQFLNHLQHLIFDTRFDCKLQKGNTHQMTYTYNNL